MQGNWKEMRNSCGDKTGNDDGWSHGNCANCYG